MKKLGIICILLLLLLGSFHEISKGTWLKNKALETVQKVLASEDKTIQVETIQTIFPTLSLKNVTIVTPKGILEIGSVEGSISLWPLFKQEISFSQLHLDQVRFIEEKTPSLSKASSPAAQTKLPFRFRARSFAITNCEISPEMQANITGSLLLQSTQKHHLQIQTKGTISFGDKLEPVHFQGKLTRHLNGDWEIDPWKASTKDIQLKGFGVFDSNQDLVQAHIQVQTDHLHTQTPFGKISYKILAKTELLKKQEGLDIHTVWQIPSLQIQNQEIEKIEGELQSTYHQGVFETQSSLSFQFLKGKWDLSFPFMKEKDKPWIFPKIALNSSLMQFLGSALWEGTRKLPSFEGTFTIPFLHDFSSNLYGSMQGECSLEEAGILQCHAEITNFAYEDFKAEKGWFYGNWVHPFENRNWELSCDIENGQFRDLQIEKAHGSTSTKDSSYPFTCTLLGTLGNPVSLDLQGNWGLQDSHQFSLTLEKGSGSFLKHPLFLVEPMHLVWGKEIFTIDPLHLQISDAHIKASLLYKNEHTDFQFSAQELPLDLFSLNPLEVEVKGVADITCSLNGLKDALHGSFLSEIKTMDLLFLKGQPIATKGMISASLNPEELRVKSELISQGNPILSLDLSLPIHTSLYPLKITPLYVEKIGGHLFCASRAETFLDFFNLGTHRIEGLCKCDLAFTGTLGVPDVQGECSLSDGYYQNYFTGTELQNVRALFRAEQNQLKISFSAEDSQNKGSCSAQGTIDLDPKNLFPFTLDLDLGHFSVATFDLIKTEISGKLAISGNLEKALAKGHVEVEESDVLIPNRLPQTTPKLDVVYLHANRPPVLTPLPDHNAYPLSLDLTLNAEDRIFITGRGVDSEWKGAFQIQGTQIDLITEGNIELLCGTLTFSGRSFCLKEGSLKWNGVPNASPSLRLAGEIQIKDILITAYLIGPLNNPQITLQSSPPLPLGTIMSYLLFGQDLGEINSSQALRFAAALTSLAGDGPGILEQTKKSLGIDRIQIVTVPSPSAEGGETIAVQVGKYVSDEVLISYSQGADNSSGNISVEVELKNNLSFILESDQANEQKQGKFTLRWNKTY